MRRLILLFGFLLLLFFINSCKLDELDFSKLSDEMGLNSEFISPVAKANITVWDLVQSANKKNNDLITKDQKGLLKIVYKKDSLFNYNVREFLNFPASQHFSTGNKVLGEISPGNISFSRNITLSDLANSLGGVLAGLVAYDGKKGPFPVYAFHGTSVGYSLPGITDFTSITVSKGSLEAVFENKLKVKVTISGSLYDLQYNRKITDFTFTDIAPNGTSVKSVDLGGVELSNRIEFRMLTFETPGSAYSPIDINMEDFIKMSFNMKDMGMSQGNVMVKSQSLSGIGGAFAFVFPDADIKAYNAALKKGSLTISIKNTSKLTGTIDLTFSEIKKNGIPVKASIPLNGNSITVDLTEADINFAAVPKFPYNLIPYAYSVEVNSTSGFIDYSATDFIRLVVSLDNLEFKSVEGDFGKRIIQIDPGMFDMNVDMFNKIDGGFKLSNPELKLIIQNSIGIPASVSLDFTATNKNGQAVSLNPPIFDIPVPPNVNAGAAFGNVIFNKENSRIVDLVALPPTGKISYKGQVDFNQTKHTISPQNPNFLDLDAMFDIGMALELPLELQVKNLTFKDTTGISGNDFDKLESAELIVNALNGIPLDVDMQFSFVDTVSKKQYGASKISKVFKAAQVNNSGVITPSQSVQTFGLDKNDIENLRKANGLVFNGTVSSSASGETVAKILSDSRLEMKVVIKSKVNL